jgi:dethiobiotin synthetase
MKAVFVSGSDTGVGKTWLVCQILRLLREQGHRSCGFKPIACGDRGDGLNMLEAAPLDGLTIDDINPWFHQPPMAPYAAAIIEERAVDWDVVDRAWDRVRSAADIVLVEGAGALMTPISSTNTMREVAARWRLPVLLVVANRLGALGQALASAECVRAAGLELEGLVLNTLPPSPHEVGDPYLPIIHQSNLSILEERYPGRVFSTENASLSALATWLGEHR